jgi:hypothetical protein
MKKTFMILMSTAFNLAVTIALILVFTIILSFFASCSAPRHGNGYHDHLRSTHHENWVKQDNGGCGWNN